LIIIIFHYQNLLSEDIPELTKKTPREKEVRKPGRLLIHGSCITWDV